MRSAGNFIGRIRAAVPARWRFAWRYRLGDTPWDTGITPPEVMEFLGRAAPGRALDLGCGTGTNALEMARRGWRVTGVDFASRAIREARRKAAREGFGIEFLAADVSDLRELAGPYDYALDIGCLHSLPEKSRAGYVAARAPGRGLHAVRLDGAGAGRRNRRAGSGRDRVAPAGFFDGTKGNRGGKRLPVGVVLVPEAQGQRLE